MKNFIFPLFLILVVGFHIFTKSRYRDKIESTLTASAQEALNEKGMTKATVSYDYLDGTLELADSVSADDDTVDGIRDLLPAGRLLMASEDAVDPSSAPQGDVVPAPKTKTLTPRSDGKAKTGIVSAPNVVTPKVTTRPPKVTTRPPNVSVKPAPKPPVKPTVKPAPPPGSPLVKRPNPSGTTTPPAPIRPKVTRPNPVKPTPAVKPAPTRPIKPTPGTTAAKAVTPAPVPPPAKPAPPADPSKPYVPTSGLAAELADYGLSFQPGKIDLVADDAWKINAVANAIKADPHKRTVHLYSFPDDAKAGNLVAKSRVESVFKKLLKLGAPQAQLRYSTVPDLAKAPRGTQPKFRSLQFVVEE